MERELAEIVTTLDEIVERAELDLFIVVARVQRIEVEDDIHAEDHRASPSSTNRLCLVLRAASMIEE